MGRGVCMAKMCIDKGRMAGYLDRFCEHPCFPDRSGRRLVRWNLVKPDPNAPAPVNSAASGAPLSEIRWSSRTRTVAALAGGWAVASGGLALVGWFFEITAFKSVLPEWVSMKVNTAVAFVLLGCAFLSAAWPGTFSSGRREQVRRWAGRGCALLAGLIGGVTLLEYAFGWGSGFDQWLLAESADMIGTFSPGRMAPDSAFCFVLLSGAIAVVAAPRSPRWALLAAATSGLLATSFAVSAVVGYSTPVLGAFGWWGLTIMAIPSAVTFLALGVVVMMLVGQPGVVSWPLGGPTTVAFACGLAVLLVVGLTASRSQARVRETGRQLAHREQVLRTFTGIVAEVAWAHSNSQSYLITGDKSHLAPFEAAVRIARQDLAASRRLIADDPKLRQQLAALRVQVEAALDCFRQLIEADRSGAGTGDLIRRGEALMSELRANFRSRELAELHDISRARLHAENVAEISYFVSSIGTAFGLAIFLTVLTWLNLVGAKRNLAVEALRRSESRLKLALDTNETGVWDLNLADRTVHRTAIFDQIFGYETLEPGWTFAQVRDHVVPEDRPVFDAGFQRAVETLGSWNFECRIRRADGAERWILCSGGHELDGRGKAVRLWGLVQNITARKVAEEEILQLNEQLEERVRLRTADLEAVNRELEAFAYSVSHDLRAPLRSIDGFSRILQEDYAEAVGVEGRDSLDRIRAASQRMAELIDDLLDLSRIGRAEMRRETVDLTALARSVAAEMTEAAPGRSVDWVVADGLIAHGDSRLLRIVLENLLGNAWKFTSRRDRARIEFGATEQDGEPAYFVRDDGAGFDPAFAGRLFGAFQRLHTADEFPGTGIGLTTVQRIVRRHGGSIRAEAAVDQGATFSFTLGAAA